MTKIRIAIAALLLIAVVAAFGLPHAGQSLEVVSAPDMGGHPK
jgi:hypothetical protein